VARKFITPVDLSGFELQNPKGHLLSSDPAGLVSGDKGLFWFNTTSNRLKYWNGSAAELKATDSDLLQGNSSAYHLARGNHSGTQVASTISDLAATVQAYRLDQFVAPNIDLTLNSHKLTNVTDPSSNQDAATKKYVDDAFASLASGQVTKGAVVAASTTNVNLASPGTTIDGVTAANGEIYLLTGQTTGSQNGPYVFNGSASAMTRAVNWDTSAEAVLGSYWIVEKGTKADNLAILTNDTAITLGTTTPTFTFISATGATYIGGNGLTLTGTTFDVGAGTGISVAADTVGIDTSVVARKIVGVIPTSTSGIFSISGAAVTINHGLSNWSAQLVLRYYTSPGSGNTSGARLEADDVASDANNIVLTLPGAPSANQYYVSITG
jgi:hypothetical protein